MNDFLTSTIFLTHIDYCGFYRNISLGSFQYPEKPLHSINLLISGHVTFHFYDGRKLSVGPNQFYYLPKNTPYKVVHKETAEHYTIVFDFLEEDSKTFDFFAASVQDDPKFLSNFQNFIRAYKHKKLGYLNQCYQSFYSLITDIQAKMNSQYLSSAQNEMLSKAYDYIQENLSSPNLTVTSISKALGVSPGYFRNIFAKKYTLSPKKYISIQRLNKACALLQNTSLSIQEITDQIGFNDATHFSTEFKKFHNTSPTEYRKRNHAIVPREIEYIR